MMCVKECKIFMRICRETIRIGNHKFIYAFCLIYERHLKLIYVGSLSFPLSLLHSHVSKYEKYKAIYKISDRNCNDETYGKRF